MTDLASRIGEALGSSIRTQSPVSGGDINEALRVTLNDGREVFVKTRRNPPPGMFEAEACGLAWLAEADALRTPGVLAVRDEFLALEWIESSQPAQEHDDLLGRGLAALHRSGANGFGLDHDNFIAVLPQDNGMEPDWPSFYGRRRLEPQLRLAVDAGRVTESMRRGFDAVLVRLSELAAPPEPPCRLHGDLWGGNAMTDAEGRPVIVDPAVYGGHREMDLAMMRLFGGFSKRCFAAYEESYPTAPGAGDRIGLYQLYPLMVHVNLFGGGYARSVEAILRQLT